MCSGGGGREGEREGRQRRRRKEREKGRKEKIYRSLSLVNKPLDYKPTLTFTTKRNHDYHF